METAHCAQIAWMESALLGHQHRRVTAPKRIAQLKQTIGPQPGNIGQDDSAPVEFDEYLLIEERVR